VLGKGQAQRTVTRLPVLGDVGADHHHKGGIAQGDTHRVRGGH
jgi:hypothetical protein